MRHFRLLVPVLALVAVARASVVPSPSAIDRINHIVVIYQENWPVRKVSRGERPGQRWSHREAGG